MPAPAMVPPIAMGLPPGLALPTCHGGFHPVGLPPVPGDAPPLEAGAVPPRMAPVSVPLSTSSDDDLRWCRGPSFFNDLLNMVINPW